MKQQTDPYIFKQIAQYFGLKKVCLQTEILGNLFKYIFFCFILLFTSSSPCRKDQFAVSYFSTSLIVLILVYDWELVCCCGFADILNITEFLHVFHNVPNKMVGLNQRVNLVACYLLILLILRRNKLEMFHEGTASRPELDGGDYLFFRYCPYAVQTI